MSKRFKKMTAVMLTIIIILSSLVFSSVSAEATQDRTYNFSTNYNLTGNPVDDIVSVAMAQQNRTKASMGYTEAWCADFVGDCADLAGLSYAIPRAGYCGTLWDNIINSGGYEVTSPQKGDIIFYYCTASYCPNSGAPWVHVGIMTSSLSSIEGNSGGKVTAKSTITYTDTNGHTYGHAGSNSVIVKYLRPKYKDEPNHNPIGVLDGVSAGNGVVDINGWAFDEDDMYSQLEINVYIGGAADDINAEPHGNIWANIYRPDVNNIYGCGEHHGFGATISTSKTGTQEVYVYALNVMEGVNILLGHKSVNIIKETLYEGVVYLLDDDKYILSKTDNELEGFIVIPNDIDRKTVFRVAKEAFKNDNKIESIKLPDSSYRIGSNCFENCTNLKSVIIPKSIIEIGQNIFGNCISLSDVYYEGTEDEWNRIQKDSDFTTINIHFNYEFERVLQEPDVIISGYYDSSYCGFAMLDCSENISGNISIPQKIHGIPTVRIALRAFEDCTQLESVVVPNSITRIGQYGFANCKNLKSISLAGSIEGLGINVFDNCTNLRNIYYEKNKDDWNNIVFDNGFNVNANIHYCCYLVPNTNAEISFFLENDYFVISGCNKEACGNIIIPKEIYGVSVGRIATHAFDGCSLIESVEIPHEIYRIGQYCFANCANIKSISLAGSIKGIGVNVFENCSNLKNIYYENGADEWNNILFDDEFDTDATIHYNSYHIYNTNATLSIYSEYGYCVISGCNKDVRGNIIIPKEIYGIHVGRMALHSFEDCSLVERIEIQDNIFRIGQYCFANCTNLQAIYLPNTITGLGSNIFDNCIELKRIHYAGSENDWCQITFDGEIGISPIVLYNAKAKEIYSIIGDTNLDGTVSISDVTTIQRYLTKAITFTDEQLAISDTNGDGKVDINDATYLQMYLAKYDVVLGEKTR